MSDAFGREGGRKALPEFYRLANAFFMLQGLTLEEMVERRGFRMDVLCQGK